MLYYLASKVVISIHFGRKLGSYSRSQIISINDCQSSSNKVEITSFHRLICSLNWQVSFHILPKEHGEWTNIVETIVCKRADDPAINDIIYEKHGREMTRHRVENFNMLLIYIYIPCFAKGLGVYVTRDL